MRRNLVGKKLPQQPKLSWTDTVTFDAGSLTGTQLKAIRTDNSDLPRPSDLHWVQVADGVTNQFTKGDHMALSSAFHSVRENTMSNFTLIIKVLPAGSITTDRSSRSFMPAVGGNTVAGFTSVVAGNGSITNKSGGGVDVASGAGSDTYIGWSALTGTINYGAKSRTIGTDEYFRVRFKLSNVSASGGTSSIVPRIDGVANTSLSITQDGSYTWYGRCSGSDIDFALQFGTSGVSGVSATIDYFHLDVLESGLTASDRADNRTATTDGLLIGVRANGATAYVDAYETSVSAGYQRGLYKDLLTSTAYNWGRSSGYRPGHEKEYVASVGNITDDGWYGLSLLAFLPVKDLWSQLYANNSAIGADIDPTAEWFVAHDIPLFLPDWDPSVEADFTAGNYSYPDAWAKDCAVRWQVSVGAVSAPTWDNNWKRAHSGASLFARNATGDRNTWAYENYDNVDFSDEPNDFTLQALGIVLGTQQFFELCDDADGSQIDIGGATPAFRGGRGKILTSGHDFSFIAAGDEYVANYGDGNPGPFANSPVAFEWRAITFIAESGQLVDITSSGIDTAGLDHWSHASAVFGFVN